MKKFYLKSKNSVPNEVILMDDLLPANGNIEPLTTYEAFKIHDSGVVKFSPMADYHLNNLMTVPSLPKTIITPIPKNGKKITSVKMLYSEKAA
jgi:hypothetical protein